LHCGLSSRRPQINEQLEVAERTVYFDGRWDFAELSSSKLIAAARQIIRERVKGRS
jgi:hypothetical protein